MHQFADQHRSTLSEKSNRKLREIRKLLDAVRQDLALGNLQKARSAITTTEQALNRIAAELDSRLAETSRQERYQRLQELQQEFLRWQKKEQMLESTLQSHPASEFPVHRDSLLQIQREISADMERCQKVHADLFALSSQLDALIKLSGRLETDLENSMRNPALSHAKSIIQQLERLIEQPVQPPDENGQSVPPKNQQENGANGGSPDIQISEFEIQLIRLTQEEILAETRRIELAQSGDLPPAERHQLQQATLRLADRQAGLIATLQKYLGPADAKIQPDKSPQPLPDKIPDIPDIPGFDCGSQPPFQDPTEQQAAEQQEAEKRTNRETGNSARKPDIRSSSPFAKQGEDLGESPDSARNRLNSIREKMESVQQLLIQRKTERENQSIQKNIITELRQFATDQQKQSGKQSSKQNSGSEIQKGNQAAKSSQATQPVGSDVENSNNQKSEEIQKRVDKIWGHLPNRIRRPELNIRSDDFLPNYRDLIKEYFKRLAREPVDR